MAEAGANVKELLKQPVFNSSCPSLNSIRGKKRAMRGMIKAKREDIENTEQK